MAEKVFNKRELDLRICNMGMSCKDYSLIVIAGLSGKDIPESVRKLMRIHEGECQYHNSATWHQSAIGTPVTKELEKSALEKKEQLAAGELLE